MTPFAASEITKDRLRIWQKRNEREQLPCTPVILVNVMHGEKSGQIVVNTLEDVTDAQVLTFLKSAIAAIEQQITRGN